MIVSTFAEFEPSEILDIEKVDNLLCIGNPEYVAKKRFGGYLGSLADTPKHLQFSYEGIDNPNNVAIPRNFHKEHPELFAVKKVEERFSKTATIRTGEFKGIFRDYQRIYYAGLDRGRFDDILMEVPCAHGKTFLGARIIYDRAVPTLILVPTYQIALQWVNTLLFTMPYLNTVLANPVKFNKLDFNDIDVCIMSFDLFDSRESKFPTGFVSRWGHVILDEAHVVGAPTYQPVLEVVPCRYRTALTATFRRSDGMQAILLYHFGKRYTMDNVFDKPRVIPMLTGFTWMDVFSMSATPGGKKHKDKNIKTFFDWLRDTEEPVKYELLGNNELINCDVLGLFEAFKKCKLLSKDVNKRLTIKSVLDAINKQQLKGSTTAIETYLTLLTDRNKLFVSIIEAVIKNGRKCIVIGKRLAQLDELYAEITNRGYSAGIVKGSNKQSKDEKYLTWCNEKADVVFGIYQLAKQGLDMDRLDTLILLNPLKDIEQPAGRINRFMDGKKQPMVIYPMDDHTMNYSMYSAAKKVTRNCKFLLPFSVSEIMEILPEKVKQNTQAFFGFLEPMYFLNVKTEIPIKD